jgi:drug/metabolite transporter (DMT)-like permease
MTTHWARTLLLTALAMVAFAANSLLCRMALGDQAIDAASFTALRLASGALMLALLVFWQSGALRLRPNPRGALYLFGYAAAFSFAYLHLNTGIGALILFGAVQLTMVTAGLRAGEPLPPLARLGLVLSLAGLVYLVSPGLTDPPLAGAALMAGAGLAWGLYSLSGRGTPDPLGATAANFLGTLPLALLLWVPFAGDLHLTGPGVVLALISGALTSGVGYAIWFAAVGGLTASAAASVQLSVPVLAAVGGILWLGEPATLRLALASVLILGGIALVLRERASSARAAPAVTPGPGAAAGK